MGHRLENAELEIYTDGDEACALYADGVLVGSAGDSLYMVYEEALHIKGVKLLNGPFMRGSKQWADAAQTTAEIETYRAERDGAVHAQIAQLRASIEGLENVAGTSKAIEELEKSILILERQIED